MSAGVPGFAWVPLVGLGAFPVFGFRASLGGPLGFLGLLGGLLGCRDSWFPLLLSGVLGASPGCSGVLGGAGARVLSVGLPFSSHTLGLEAGGGRRRFLVVSRVGPEVVPGPPPRRAHTCSPLLLQVGAT